MKNFLCFCAWAALLSACHEPSQIPLISLDGFDEDARENGEGLAIDSFFVVPLQSDNECMLAGVKKIVPVDSLVIVVSERDVLAFNRQGMFVRRFGRQGNGEGEYNRVSTAYWEKETNALHVVDGIRNRILIFGLDGHLLETKFFPPSTFSLLGTAESINENRLFCANLLYNDQNSLYFDFDIEEERADSVFRFLGRTDNTQEYVGRHPFAVCDDKVVCVLPFDNRIFEYSLSERSWQPWLEVRTDKAVLEKVQLEEIDDYGIFRYAEELSRDVFVGFTDVFVTGEYYLFGFSNLYYAVAEKASGRVVKYDYGVERDEVCHLPLLNISALDDEGFLIGYEDAFELKSWHFADSVQDDRLREMARVVSAMSEADNPLLLFYKLGD